MKAVVLAAGYGTRLERDLQYDTSGKYSHLLGIPKPLLPVGGVPLVTHWIQCFSTVPQISSLVVVVNDLHKPLYEQWSKTVPQEVTIVSDGSSSNEGRSGAVACMALGVQGCPNDTLFVAGDTLLKYDFSLATMISKFESMKKEDGRVCLVLGCPVSEENVSKHGIIEIDESNCVRRLLEKPQSHETASRLQCPCVYLISAASLPLIQEFLDHTREQPLSCRDATGKFISALVKQVRVYCLPVAGRYDVGGLQSYLSCCTEFASDGMVAAAQDLCKVKYQGD